MRWITVISHILVRYYYWSRKTIFITYWFSFYRSMPTLRLFDNSHPYFPLIDFSGCSDSKLAWTGNLPQWREIFADLLLTCTCSCYLYDFMHFDLGGNEASHQGPICAVCVGTGQWQRSLDRWGPFDQQCNAALDNVLTWSLRIDFITVFRSQTSRIFRCSV